jgi:hypothetical protein
VTTAEDKISILGPNDDGSYVVEFKTAAGKKLAIVVPEAKTAVQPSRMLIGRRSEEAASLPNCLGAGGDHVGFGSCRFGSLR